MASVNKVILVGNLGRDPETRVFPNGDPVANVTIATTDKWKDKRQLAKCARSPNGTALCSTAAWLKLPVSTCAKVRRSTWKAACARASGPISPARKIHH